ncbi:MULTISPECIES: RNA polymerase sigma-70 factor [Niastella]|uniref:RNA polymerase sigma-70 factor n=1 Tax=Niastella soli TaxID=2821487 RepID=A0ABS3YSZ6_9BACT|nr:RNA polymerase sigma-70 factor [Niastella soli]MBO9201007.1 RNA polymerase sigma-70 factor [Niastella soli]
MYADQTFNLDSNDASMFAIKNDAAAFEQYFKQHFASLCTWCQHKYEFDSDIAKEVVHTAFIKLWKVRATLPPEMPIKAFLHKVISNTSLDILRHAKVRERFQHFVQQRNENAGPPTPQENYDSKKLQDDIDTAISELPEQMRTIFELSRYEGLKYAEIARQLNVSVNTVETQMGRALKKLRIRLAAYLSSGYFIIMIINNIII